MARISKREKRKQFKELIKLHKALCRAYTDKQYFHTGQVKTAFDKTKTPKRFLGYAYALYCAKADFNEIYGLPLHSDEYAHNRIDVCEMHFNGDSALGWTEGVTRDWPRTRKYTEQWNINGAGNANAGVGGRW